MLKFPGKKPSDLGVRNGRLRPCHWKPNHVSSQAETSDQQHYIDPLPLKGDLMQTKQAIKAAVSKMQGAKITLAAEEDDYLHYECASKTLGFIDDLELYIDIAGKKVDVRCGARLGIRDFEVNRKRVEQLRKLM